MASIEVELPKELDSSIKKWHDGKTTYTANIAMVLTALAGLFGFGLNETLPIDIARFGDDITYIIIGIAGVIGFYGRAKAISAGFIGKKRITK